MYTKEEIFFDLNKDMRTSYGPRLFQEGVVVDENAILLYGPYATLPSGRWVVSVSGHVDSVGRCYVDAAAESGNLILGGGNWSNELCTFEIESSFPLRAFEVRVYADSGAFVRVDRVSVEQKVDPRQRRTFASFDRMGLSLLLDSTSLVDRAIIETGAWEQPHIDYMRESAFKYANSSRNLVFLDVGSYFGIYSLLMSRTNLFNKIVAFEADVLNFRQLCANLLLNDPTCLIEARNVAVSDDAGAVMFESSLHHPDNRGGVGINEQGTLACVDKRQIKKDRIDSLVPVEGKIVFAKVDVEGHELNVLRGMRQTIANNKILVQVETFYQLPEVTELMNEMGCHLVNKIGDEYFFSNI